jgi:hypothetical protein
MTRNKIMWWRQKYPSTGSFMAHPGQYNAGFVTNNVDSAGFVSSDEQSNAITTGLFLDGSTLRQQLTHTGTGRSYNLSSAAYTGGLSAISDVCTGVGYAKATAAEPAIAAAWGIEKTRKIWVVDFETHSTSSFDANIYSLATNPEAYRTLWIDKDRKIVAGLVKYELDGTVIWDKRADYYTPEGGTGFTKVYSWSVDPFDGAVYVVGCNDSGPKIMCLGGSDGAKISEWGWDSAYAYMDPNYSLSPDANWAIHSISSVSGYFVCCSNNVIYMFYTAHIAYGPTWTRKIELGYSFGGGCELLFDADESVVAFVRHYDSETGKTRIWGQTLFGRNGIPTGPYYLDSNPFFETTAPQYAYGLTTGDCAGFSVRRIT